MKGVGAHVKACVAKATTQTKAELKTMVECILCRLQKYPVLVAKLLLHTPLRLAVAGGLTYVVLNK